MSVFSSCALCILLFSFRRIKSLTPTSLRILINVKERNSTLKSALILSQVIMWIDFWQNGPQSRWEIKWGRKKWSNSFTLYLIKKLKEEKLKLRSRESLEHWILWESTGSKREDFCLICEMNPFCSCFLIWWVLLGLDFALLSVFLTFYTIIIWYNNIFFLLVTYDDVLNPVGW